MSDSHMITLAEAVASIQSHLANKRPASEQAVVIDGDIGRADCLHCRGLGYYRPEFYHNGVRVDLPVTHKLFGKLIQCECLAGTIAQRAVARSLPNTGLTPDERATRWGDLIPLPEITVAIRAIQATIAQGWGWCYLYGPPGPGKSTVLKTAIAELAALGRPAHYVNWSDMLAHIRSGYSTGDFDARIEAWRTVEVLAIDEFGRAKESDWVFEIESRVLNDRYQSAVAGRNQVTLFASNYGPAHFSEWMTSRILDGRFKIVDLRNAPDLRPAMEA